MLIDINKWREREKQCGRGHILGAKEEVEERDETITGREEGEQKEKESNGEETQYEQRDCEFVWRTISNGKMRIFTNALSKFK